MERAAGKNAAGGRHQAGGRALPPALGCQLAINDRVRAVGQFSRGRENVIPKRAKPEGGNCAGVEGTGANAIPLAKLASTKSSVPTRNQRPGTAKLLDAATPVPTTSDPSASAAQGRDTW